MSFIVFYQNKLFDEFTGHISKISNHKSLKDNKHLCCVNCFKTDRVSSASFMLPLDSVRYKRSLLFYIQTSGKYMGQ